MTQKFQHGDLVRVADDLGYSMAHFKAGCDAIVIGSYNDQYGGGKTRRYTLAFENGGQSSWYYEDQLTLIERGRADLLEKWKRAAKDEAMTKADLDWIFANGEDVLRAAHGASIKTLAACLGCNDLWGSRGEGYTYYANAMATLSHAAPFLKAGDRAGWERYAAKYRAKKGSGKG